MEARRLSIQRCIRSLVHAVSCMDDNCQMPSCAKMKRVVTHTRCCKRKTNTAVGCPVCKQMIALCCYHARYCSLQTECKVPFCQKIKQKMHQVQMQSMVAQEVEIVQALKSAPHQQQQLLDIRAAAAQVSIGTANLSSTKKKRRS